MTRRLAVILALLMLMVAAAETAEAGGRRFGGRHFRGHRFRHHSSRFVFHFGGFYPFYRPYYGPYYGYRYRYYVPEPCCAYTYAPAPAGGGEVLGAILGGIGGGVIGHQIGSGGGRAAATVVGSLIGVIAGSEIGRQLDDVHRLRLARATQYALERSRSGTQVGWRDPDTGVGGTVVPQPAWKNPAGQYCREFQQTVVIGGREQSAYGTACRRADGQWELVN